MKDKLLKQASREYSSKQRAVGLVLLAPIFLFLLPYFFTWLGTKVDGWLGLPAVFPPPIHWLIAGLLILPGIFFAMWSIYSQFTIGRGTPVPLMATQKLIIQPPFAYCRNPMALGTFGMYLGLAALFRSIGTGLLVLVFAGLLLIYIKRVEEKEMELRFGAEYLAYKEQTPFLIPRFWNHPGK